LNWSWSPSTGLSDPNVPNPVASPIATTTYTLTGIDVFGCMSVDSITVNVESNMNVVIANILTPNNDSKNDTWIVDGIEFYPNTQVKIVNREGEIVYESDAYDNTWNGTFNGKLLPDATYYYILVFENEAKVYKGAVTLLKN
jgi:gliding motility-associated-like protein